MNEKVVISDGLLVSPDLHDAKVFGIIANQNETLVLLLELVDGTFTRLVFHDVCYLRATDFREGNIALDMEVLAGDQVELEDITSLYDSATADLNEVLTGLLNRVRNEGKLVAKLSASYGCALTCICGDITERLGRISEA